MLAPSPKSVSQSTTNITLSCPSKEEEPKMKRKRKRRRNDWLVLKPEEASLKKIRNCLIPLVEEPLNDEKPEIIPLSRASKLLATSSEIIDLEEIYSFGVSHSACPYYLVREGGSGSVSSGNVSRADIIFVPYNYIIDSKARNAQGIDLKNSILIFDEAHNLEGSCAEANSFDLELLQLIECSKEMAEIISEIIDRPSYTGSFGVQQYQFVRSVIEGLYHKLDSLSLNTDGQAVFEGEFILV